MAPSSNLKSRKDFFRTVHEGPPTGWYRIAELPIRETLAFKLIKEGVLFSVLAGTPGSKRGVRLVSAESWDAYVRKLAEVEEAEVGK